MDNKHSNYSLLFVEDDSVTLENYSQVMREVFSNVYQAKDGLSAYAIYKEKKPDIMIIDVDIPKLNGIDLLKKIRETDLNTKAILFTSYSDTETLLEATALKLTQYLIKPVTRKELFSAIDLALKDLQAYTFITKDILKLRDEFTWDNTYKTLLHKGSEVPLTKKEKEIFMIMLQLGQSQRIIPYSEIIERLWEHENKNALQSLKTFISCLRKKLPTGTIKNEFSLGYRLITDA